MAELNTQVVIFGAGRTGTATAKTLTSGTRKYYIKGFIDDDPNLQGKTINGQKIYGRDKQEYVIKYKDIDQLIIATNRISTERKNEIFELCHANNVKVLTVPPIKTWSEGKLNANQITEIQIEDLLGRRNQHKSCNHCSTNARKDYSCYRSSRKHRKRNRKTTFSLFFSSYFFLIKPKPHFFT